MDTGIRINLVSMKVYRLLNLAIEATASKNAPDSTMFHSQKMKNLSTLNNRIQHFAIAFSKDKLDHPATVQSADVTCIRLY